jgi:hypothetical protein
MEGTQAGIMTRNGLTRWGMKSPYVELCFTATPASTRLPRFTRATYTAVASLGLGMNSTVSGWMQHPSLVVSPADEGTQQDCQSKSFYWSE